MRKLITLAFVTITSIMYGQHQFGIHGGVDFFKFTGFANQGKTGLIFGSSYNYTFKNNFVFTSGLEFEQKGSIDEYRYLNQQGNDINNRSEYSLDYISIPLTAGYKWGNRFFGSVNAGIGISYLVNRDLKIETFNTNDELISSYSHDLNDEINSFDLTSILQLRGGYAFSEQHAISLTVRLSHGITTISRNSSNAVDLRNTGGHVVIGYIFTL